jgi:hypothetical protein
MRQYTLREIQEAADDGEGFCLQCSAQQEYLEPRMFLGLCLECDNVSVLPAETLVRALRLVDLEGEEADS